MLEKLAIFILNAIAWIIGIFFILIALVVFTKDGFLIGILILFSAISLLPPVRNIILSKIPRIDVWRLTTFSIILTIGSVIVSFVTVGEHEDFVQTTETSSNILLDDPVVSAQTNNNISEPDIQEPQMLISPENNDSEDISQTESNVILTEEETIPIVDEVLEPEDTSTNDDCSGMYRTCGEMDSCEQAYRALECGNGKLDRDNDGIPCESICG